MIARIAAFILLYGAFAAFASWWIYHRIKGWNRDG